MVTPLLHQIWFDLGKGPEPYGQYAKTHATWRKHNPELAIKVWNQADIEALIRKHNPELANLLFLIRTNQPD